MELQEQFRDEGARPEDEVRSISLQQDIVEAQVRAELITMRQWNKKEVEASLAKIMKQMEEQKVIWQ